MRLISVTKIKEGDIIAKDIMSNDGGVLLRRHSKFKDAFRQKFLDRNIYEIYIEDELSEGIEPTDILDPQVRHKVTRDIKGEFEKLKKDIHINADIFVKVSDILVGELSKKDLVCEMIDLKLNDNYTYEHCIGVGILTAIVCRKMDIDVDNTQKIVMGALMHDIGKIIIPKDILNKKEKFTEDEWQIMKSHAEIGYKIIKENRELSPITKLAVLCHHEREDGSGYPLGKAEQLHIGTKIVAACDVFHALLSDRPYRKGLPLSEVISAAAREKLNVPIRETIEGILAFYPIGCTVLLSNGDVGLVEKNFAQDIKSPLIRVIYNMQTKKRQNYRLNLQEDRSITIIQRLPDIPSV